MMVKGESGMLYEGERFARALTPRVDSASIIALSGDLGAGKTAFVKGVARALGVAEHITSPTFVIMKSYVLSGQAFGRLVHIDAYRLKGERHLKVLGWDELTADPANLIFIEWPEMAEAAIPETAVRIAFRYTGEDEREILFQKADEAVGAA